MSGLRTSLLGPVPSNVAGKPCNASARLAVVTSYPDSPESDGPDSDRIRIGHGSLYHGRSREAASAHGFLGC